MEIHGTYTAIVTPFNNDASEIDYKSLESLIDFQIKSGVNGLVVAGSTGEAATLTAEEYPKLIKFCAEYLKKYNTNLVVGVSANSTAKASELAKIAQDSGAQALLIVAPYYNKPPQAGIIEHFAQIKKSTNLPLIAYNIPGRSVVNILPETIAKMTERGLIVALKEAQGNMDQVMDLSKLVGDKISIMSGECSLTYSMMALGAKGVISATSNIAPTEFSEMTKIMLQGSYLEARKLQFALTPIIKMAFMETNPIPLKMALALRGIIKSPSLRLPLMQAGSGTIETIKHLYSL